MVIVLSAMLVFCGGYVFFLKNVQNKKIIIAKNKFILEKQLDKKQAQIKQVILYKKQIAELNKIYIKDKKQLIAVTLPLLLDQLGKMAQSNQVTLQSMLPFPTKQQDQLVVYPLQFAIVGTYNQISQFVTTLVDAFSFVALPDIKLTKVKDNKLNMQTTCIIYGKQDHQADE